ncbi:MAG: SpoIIE family protein phosphatase [Acidobacteriota bacterium]|nr:SpoIIE family protein phosphatase [Blastocatellia bacterium]MDW8413708.1 SpoIIE family protein phosphatase [Acidobacteriota bacterium]
MAKLLLERPGNESREIKLTKVKISIGRSSRNDICVNDPYASRLHAEIRKDGKIYYLTDLGSANGTFCNGTRVTGTIPIKVGDVVQIGETRLSLVSDSSSGSSNEIMLSDDRVQPEAELTISSTRHTSDIFAILKEVTGGEQARSISKRQPDNTFVSAPTQLETPSAALHKRDLLAIVSKVGVALLSDASLDDTLRLVMDLVFDAIPAERGYLLLSSNWAQKKAKRPERSAELICRVARSKTRELVGEEIKISRAISEKVVSEGISVLTSDATHDPRFQDRQSIMLSNIRSIMAVPLAVESEIIGMIYVDNPYATGRFTEDELRVLTALASVAAIKIENARLMEERIERKRIEEELKVAGEIQSRLHPLSPPRVPGYDMVGVSFPCREVGGDYYDFIKRKNGRIIFAIGDVSGKGIGAALLMSSLHAALRAQAQTGLGPAEILTEVNNYIFESSPENKFLTLFCAELDPATGALIYSNAGHNAPVLVSKDGKTLRLTTGGLPIGIVDDIVYDSGMLFMNPGDVVVAYTDGVPDSVNRDDEDFGEERLAEVVQKYRSKTAAQIRDRIEEALAQFVGQMPAVDDMTLVVVKRLE